MLGKRYPSPFGCAAGLGAERSAQRVRVQPGQNRDTAGLTKWVPVTQSASGPHAEDVTQFCHTSSCQTEGILSERGTSYMCAPRCLSCVQGRVVCKGEQHAFK